MSYYVKSKHGAYRTENGFDTLEQAEDAFHLLLETDFDVIEYGEKYVRVEYFPMVIKCAS